MTEYSRESHATGSTGAVGEEELYISVPARARDEIGELAYYLEQTLQKLREVNQHLEGSSRDVPGVLRDLREIVRMTEAGTVTVLEEAEALMDDGQTAGRLIAEIQRCVQTQALAGVEPSLGKLAHLVGASDARITSIMSALQFQDLTAQKMQRAFEILEEVVSRLTRIRALLDLGSEGAPGVDGSPADAVESGEEKTGQALADELLRGFAG